MELIVESEESCQLDADVPSSFEGILGFRTHVCYLIESFPGRCTLQTSWSLATPQAACAVSLNCTLASLN